MIYARPGVAGALFDFRQRYQNFIGGEWVAPLEGNYFENITPVTGEVFCEVPRSTPADLNRALDAAHAAADAWGRAPVAERSNTLLKIADRIEANLETLAFVETWENGKGIRETLNQDLPLLVDHFRYFAGCIRAQEGSAAEIDANTVSYHFHEPLGVVAQIIPWNFPMLMAGWKLAPALAAGNCVVLKPAEQTPVSVLVLMEMIADLLPPGVVNILNGYGEEIGKALASSDRIAKIAFTGSTAVGHLILADAAKSLIPSTVEQGGKSPNIYFEDVMQQEEEFVRKCIEGVLLGFFNQGEVCTCPSRALVQESIYGDFIERVLSRQKHQAGQPPGYGDDVGRPGLQGAVRQGHELYGDSAGGGGPLPDGRRQGCGGQRYCRRLLCGADPAAGHQRHAGIPGGDFRSDAGCHHFQGRDRGAGDRQRHPVRSRRRPLDPRHQPGVPYGPGHQGGPCVGELLPPLPDTRRVWRIQEVGHRPRVPQEDAGALPADQEHAGKLRHQPAGFFLAAPALSSFTGN
jgi:acyl-CoA reductase-like NAD-dependent aldehyde dehydrogenase